jgi:hypothetical protein
MTVVKAKIVMAPLDSVDSAMGICVYGGPLQKERHKPKVSPTASCTNAGFQVFHLDVRDHLRNSLGVTRESGTPEWAIRIRPVVKI